MSPFERAKKESCCCRRQKGNSSCIFLAKRCRARPGKSTLVHAQKRFCLSSSFLFPLSFPSFLPRRRRTGGQGALAEGGRKKERRKSSSLSPSLFLPPSLFPPLSRVSSVAKGRRRNPSFLYPRRDVFFCSDFVTRCRLFVAFCCSQPGGLTFFLSQNSAWWCRTEKLIRGVWEKRSQQE